MHAAKEEEKHILLEQGLNPELVLRKRERKAAAETQQQQLAERTRAHEVEVCSRTPHITVVVLHSLPPSKRQK
jgi:hypothetical protein